MWSVTSQFPNLRATTLHGGDSTRALRFVRQFFRFALGPGFEPRLGTMSQFFKFFQKTTTHEWYRHPVELLMFVIIGCARHKDKAHNDTY